MDKTADEKLAARAAKLKLAASLRYVQYDASKEALYLPDIRELISKDLSEPYSIYVYRYFLYQWADLCFMVRLAIVSVRAWTDFGQALDEHDNMVGVVVSKLEQHRGGPLRGYIAMLATKTEYRGAGIATVLVRMAIKAMIAKDADEVGSPLHWHCTRQTDNIQVALETEIDNQASLRLYQKLGFLRTKRLHRYYLNGNTAFRLVLYLRRGVAAKPTYPTDQPPLLPDQYNEEDYI